jgi:hypothetical protein
MNLPKLREIPPQKLFLVDSLGALLSALLLGLVLAQFDKTFGMPQNVLYVLSVIPCIFAVYSFLCFLIKTTYWRFLMKIIATANILYCFLTLGMMVYFHPQLTVLGLLYFTLEIAIVVILACIEWKTAAHFMSNT